MTKRVFLLPVLLCAAAHPQTKASQELAFKPGLWSSHDIFTTLPAKTLSDITRSTCHDPAYDHAMYRKDNASPISRHCKHMVDNRRLRERSITMTCKTPVGSSTVRTVIITPDDDHLDILSRITYTPALGGVTGMTNSSHYTYQGPCPEGMAPGDTDVPAGRILARPVVPPPHP